MLGEREQGGGGHGEFTRIAKSPLPGLCTAGQCVTVKHSGKKSCTQNHRCLFLGGGGSSHDELRELAHEKALEKSVGINNQSCPVLRLSHKRLHSKSPIS